MPRGGDLTRKVEMKPRRLFPLVLFAAITATMLATASQASATVLCGIQMEVCPEGRAFAAKTEFSGSLVAKTTATLAIGEKDSLSCEESALSGITNEKQAEPLKGELSTFTFGKCTLKISGKSSSCSSVSGTNLPFLATFAYSKEEEKPGHGTLALSSSGKGTPTIAFTCEKVKCSYSMEPTFKIGGEPAWAAVVKASAKGVTEECALNPKATFSATYAMAKPLSGDLFVAKEVAQGTKLCKVNPPVVGGVRQCPAGEGYAGPAIEVNLPAATSAKFLTGMEEVNCNEMKLTGNFQENGAFAALNGGIQTFTYKTNNGNCTSTLAGNPAVTVTMINLAYNESEIAYFQRENPQAQLGFQGSNGVVKLRMVIGAVTCNYRRDALSAQISNGAGAGGKTAIEISATWELEVQPGGCPMALVQIPINNLAKFEQGGGANLYVAKE